MRFLSAIIFLAIFACNSNTEQTKEEVKTELVLLSEKIAESPDNPELFSKRAEYFITKDNFESALMDYKEAVELFPTNGHYHYKLAYKGDYIDADDQFSLKWNDPEIGINWLSKNPILSERDK